MTDSTSDALLCQSVYLLQALGECYRCTKSTRMFAMMALPPFAFEGDQDQAMDDDGAMLRELADLPTALVESMRPIVGTAFRKDYSHTAGIAYWMNHCERCDAKQGDHFVQGPDGPFWPNDESDMATIQATRFDGRFRFQDACTAYSGAMADWRDRRNGVPPAVAPPRKARKPRTKPARPKP